MAHFCGFIKLIFLLLMLERMLESSETRPLKGSTAAATSSDLIAGNEFLKLFMDREELETEFYNKPQYEGGGRGGGGGSGNGGVASGVAVTESFKDSEEFDKKSAETGRSRRLQNARSLKVKAAKVNQAGDGDQSIDLKQVGKFQGPVSKVVYMDDDYEENDAILDAEVRDIDLQRERYKDEYKVVAPSSSASASQRGMKNRVTTTTSKYDNKSYTSTKSIVTMTPRPPVATTTNKPSSSSSSSSSSLTSKSTKTDTAATATGDNFINRSHKSEHSIEEVEPSAAKQPQQQQQRQQHRKPQQHKSRKSYTRHRTTYPITSVADTLEALDSENSESTNIQNVLASPLQPAASLRSMSAVTTTYHSGQRNVSINHDTAAAKVHKSNEENDTNLEQTAATGGGGVDDQLLPFQTVIYHDTKDGHGPQSRSISYSSISQNVEDLKKWHQSGILAEARRNVSESLKLPHSHQSEPSKFYSQPSKMYSEPSKFYSEPAKVYSEPAKVYGEPEKFYSEPAKNYGQPAKFYSEPSKIYSQPSKVYSEPAKTYWPVSLTTTSSTTGRPVTFNPTTNQPQVTTTSPNAYHGSRKPAIVSRIAFGEAAGTTTSSSTTTTSTTPSPTTTSTTTTTTTTTKPFSSYHHRTYGHRQPSTGTSTAFSSPSSERINENTSSATPSRRILFNLDRLPYDLLNAPQPATQQQQHHHLLEPQQPQRSQQQQQQHALTYQQQQQQQSIQPQQRHHNNINPCLESAVSSLFSSSTLSAHPALIKQRQQHSSLSDQQHSNQNAKGLPNGDLVRCVAEIAHTATTSPNDGIAADDVGLQYTTEHSSNIEELFTPTPEQNYEIEESVSVMTNGRAHGVLGGGGRNSLQLATTTPVPPPLLAPQVFKPNRQRVHFGTNLNGGAEAVAGGGGHLSQTSYNTNANANRGLHGGGGVIAGDGNTSPDYNSYDDGDNDDSNNDEYTDDDTARHRGGSGAANGGEDDSKVAYVVEGRNYRKYRVEEKTDDGFIVGEYGVVDHNDGNLRGVRYTADSTINRSLIQKALLTFLKLK